MGRVSGSSLGRTNWHTYILDCVISRVRMLESSSRSKFLRNVYRLLWCSVIDISLKHDSIVYNRKKSASRKLVAVLNMEFPGMVWFSVEMINNLIYSLISNPYFPNTFVLKNYVTHLVLKLHTLQKATIRSTVIPRCTYDTQLGFHLVPASVFNLHLVQIALLVDGKNRMSIFYNTSYDGRKQCRGKIASSICNNKLTGDRARESSSASSSQSMFLRLNMNRLLRVSCTMFQRSTESKKWNRKHLWYQWKCHSTDFMTYLSSNAHERQTGNTCNQK